MALNEKPDSLDTDQGPRVKVELERPRFDAALPNGLAAGDLVATRTRGVVEGGG